MRCDSASSFIWVSDLLLDPIGKRLLKGRCPIHLLPPSLQVSPDGLLLQSSTLSDPVRYKFSCGAEADIAGSYIEFVERRPLLDLQSVSVAILSFVYRTVSQLYRYVLAPGRMDL